MWGDKAILNGMVLFMAKIFKMLKKDKWETEWRHQVLKFQKTAYKCVWDYFYKDIVQSKKKILNSITSLHTEARKYLWLLILFISQKFYWNSIVQKIWMFQTAAKNAALCGPNITIVEIQGSNLCYWGRIRKSTVERSERLKGINVIKEKCWY